MISIYDSFKVRIRLKKKKNNKKLKLRYMRPNNLETLEFRKLHGYG